MASFVLNGHRRRVVAAFVALVSSASQVHAQPAPDPKASLADADKASRAKDWATAARSYDAANKVQPSAEALEGLANAQYNGGQLGEAHASYTEWLAKYGPKAPPAKKKTAETRLKELTDKTGTVGLTVSETGAAVIVDDKPAGTTPLASPLRLAAGIHKVRVTKDGFLPFEGNPNVTAGGATTLQVNLSPSATKGKLVVKEKTGKPIRVLVDNVDMGEAPWSGDVDPGSHQVSARGVGLVATPEKVLVERGRTHEVELTASSSSAPVRIGTSDGKGLVYLDGKLVGEGSFVGDVPAGTHQLKITREGYDPFEESIEIKEKEPFGRTVTLKISSKIETGPVQEVERLEGVYGGFTLLGMFTPGGTNSSIERDCDDRARVPTLLSCEAPSGLGGGVGGFLGYHWDPVGIELFVAAQYDQRTLKNDVAAASTDPGIGPDPARFESFNVRRTAGLGAARVRLTLQTKKLRFGFAAGAGVSRRVLFLDRRTTAKDDGAVDIVIADGEGYWSPVVTFEPSVMYRASPGVAIMLGAQIFLDAPGTFLNGDKNPRTDPAGNRAVGLRSLSTPSYELAADMQIFIGPFVGMMFGP